MRAVAAERDVINAARGEGEFAVADSRNRVKTGAGERSRTLDLRITNALLYQLSYTGKPSIISIPWPRLQLRPGAAQRPPMPVSVDAPFQKICTPMHSRMNAVSLATTMVPTSPSLRSTASA
jgi:hypothetical protein